MPGKTQTKIGPPILIVGYMHSGTTLLQQILGRHQDIYISGGETRFFVNLSTTKRKFADLSNDETLRSFIQYLLKVILTGYARVNFTGVAGYKPVDLADHNISDADLDDLLQVARLERSHTALYPIVFDFLARKHGKSRWLDKLAGYVSQVDSMRKVLPDAQIIELVRDPRDILASKKRRAVDGGSYDPLWDSLAWKTAVRSGVEAQQISQTRGIRVRYEDLVSKPELTSKQVCQFLDLDFDADMLTVGWINSTTVQSEGADAQIGTAAVGNWKYTLPAAHASLCQWITKHELEMLEYELDSVSPTVYFALPVLVLRSGIEFFTRLSQKWRRGGFDLVRSVFNNYRLRFSRLLRF